MNCLNCGKSDKDRPMAFRGEEFCCDKCRKEMGKDLVNPYGGQAG